MIQLRDVKLEFGGHALFYGVTFTVGPRERVGLIGRNGSGKTTLLNLMSGLLDPDDGVILTPGDCRIGYLTQEVSFTRSTVLEEGCAALRERCDESWRAEKILFGLGFSGEQLSLHPRALSDGFQARLHLAKTLIADPDLLLLDEPTNYLDIVSIRWLSGFLSSLKGELVIVTHDRGFMDTVTTHTMMIHRKKIRKIRGPTGKMYEQIAREEEVHEKTRLNDEKKRRETELFISRFRAKARLAGLVQSRIKTLRKNEKLQQLEKPEDLEFSFHFHPFPARFLMEARSLGFGYDIDSPLIRDFTLSIGRQDRIGVMGKNGTGKSTLLRILAGELDPNTGTVREHPETRVGYFGSGPIEGLDPALTVYEEIARASDTAGRREVMDVCGAMLFGDDRASKKIGVLSGGEKSRVLLGRILMSPVNLLLLDEPTNHLDIESCDSFMAAIDRFPGGVVIVTHSELFLRTLVDRLVVFGNGPPRLFEGEYDEFIEHEGYEEERGIKSGPSVPSSRKQARIRRADIVAKKSKALGPVESLIQSTEATIERLEERIAANNEDLARAASSGLKEKISRLARENHGLKEELGRLYRVLEGALDEHEAKKLLFERELDRAGPVSQARPRSRSDSGPNPPHRKE